MVGRSGVYVRCTCFNNEEIVLFYCASSFPDIVPAFSFMAVNQNVLRASFCTFPVVTFGVRIIAYICGMQQAGHGVFFDFQKILLRNDDGFLIGESVFLLFHSVFVCEDKCIKLKIEKYYILLRKYHIRRWWFMRNFVICEMVCKLKI